MAHSSHEIKDIRKTKKRTARNLAVRETIKTNIKKFRKAVVAKEATTEEMIKDLIKKLDKASQKGILKKNNASRRKSRLVKLLNKSKKA